MYHAFADAEEDASSSFSLSKRTARRIPAGIFGLVVGSLLVVAFVRSSPTALDASPFAAIPPAAATTALFGPSGQYCGGSKAAVIDVEELRLAATAFVAELDDDVKHQAYYADAAKQVPQWQVCTIVQQCLVPKYGLAVGRLKPRARTRFYDMLALALSDESYKRILTQQLSNLLLGEMQNWAVQCEGTCAELDDPSGLLPAHLLLGEDLKMHLLDANYTECSALQAVKRKTFWRCDREPRMLHHGNIDTETGRYYLGNVFLEPEIHARNRFFDFVSVYGSLEKGEPFGFRYSGHHFDLSFRVSADGLVTDLPTFLGHNPLIVPQMSPPIGEDLKHDGDEDYLQWRNMAGVPQFPDAVRVILAAASVLKESWYLPLNQWDSTPSTGGLTRKGGKTIEQTAHVDLSTLSEGDFQVLWDLIDYTLEFARGARARPEKEAFRKSGKLCWTTVDHTGEGHHEHVAGRPFAHLPKTVEQLVKARQFFYVEAQTDDLLYFGMVNSLFSLMLQDEPSNHLHSILIPKAYLA